MSFASTAIEALSDTDSDSFQYTSRNEIEFFYFKSTFLCKSVSYNMILFYFNISDSCYNLKKWWIRLRLWFRIGICRLNKTFIKIKFSKISKFFVNNFGFMHFLTGGNELQSHFHVKNICKNYANRNQFVTGSQFQNFSKFMFSRRKPWHFFPFCWDDEKWLMGAWSNVL